jgi:hypothetical protein
MHIFSVFQEACGGNNRKPFKHFSLPPPPALEQFLWLATTFSIPLRSGQDFHLAITTLRAGIKLREVCLLSARRHTSAALQGLLE